MSTISTKTAKSSMNTSAPSEISWTFSFLYWMALFYFITITVFLLPLVMLIFFLISWPFKFIYKPIHLETQKFIAWAGCFHFVTCSKLMGIEVHVFGDDITKMRDQKCLVLLNHLAILDHFLFMTAVNELGSGVCGKWMFVIYNVWIYTPLGLLWYLHGNFFVNTTEPDKRQMQLDSLKNHFDTVYYENEMNWVAIYPEGSRLFLIKKINANFEKRNSLTSLNHCAYPRLGAALNILQVLGPSVNDPNVSNNGKGRPLKYLVDVTLGYPEGVIYGIDELVFQNFRNGTLKKFAVHFKIYDLDPNWKNEKELKKFLFDVYQKKDNILDQYYKTGKFPGPEKLATYPNQISMFLFQLFLFVASYFIIKLFLKFFFLKSLHRINFD